MPTLTVDTVREIVQEELPRWFERHPDLVTALEQAEGSPRPGRMTYQEFLDWADEDTLAEWVDGKAIMYSPASKQHQAIAGFLIQVLGAFVELRNLGTVIGAPFQMKMEQGREPDLIFVAREHLDRLQKSYLDGPADVAVEITSPESGERDRGAKFFEYEAGGVREYWLIDPLRQWAEFYRLDEGGRYQIILAGGEGVFCSQVVPGFWLRVEWLWQEPLPAVDQTLLEIEAEERAQHWLSIMAERWGREQIQRWLLDDAPPTDAN